MSMIAFTPSPPLLQLHFVQSAHLYSIWNNFYHFKRTSINELGSFILVW